MVYHSVFVVLLLIGLVGSGAGAGHVSIALCRITVEGFADLVDVVVVLVVIVIILEGQVLWFFGEDGW